MKAADPQQEEKLRRLLRLKRYEQPPEGFAEEFLEKFQRRQRTEIVRRSSITIFRERFAEWLHGLHRPAVLWSAAAVYAAVMVTLWLLPRPVPQNGQTIVVGGAVVTTPQVGYQPDANATRVGSPTAPNTGVPERGKRRTVIQDQDKKDIIGPEQPGKEDEEKLRDL